MIVIKKYTAIRLNTTKVDDEIKLDLTYGSVEGPYYNQRSPDEEFDTEEAAIAYAYEKDKCARWLILPIIRFGWEE
ncbi:MAG TPA: hypothetical protein VNX68_15645 [Nitrosopumilaceae archaeon]|jgi:hypothetical protein|nr:hypothetical protein [Nitrosopumilaceae archaeon]